MRRFAPSTAGAQYQVGQRPRAHYRLPVPLRHNRPGDMAGATLLSVLPENVGLRVCRKVPDQVRRRSPGCRVHAHVKWSFHHEAESPFRNAELF